MFTKRFTVINSIYSGQHNFLIALITAVKKSLKYWPWVNKRQPWSKFGKFSKRS